jgi:DNA-binding NarL/FixJ family response regulator
MSEFRVLVVEDHEPFRRFICSTLGKKADLQIVSEVSDGSEAVLKAQQLQPDLILLDIGLPTLNGIEVARRIRALSPNSKIVFVTQEFSAEVVQEAFRVGALGYVIKTQAGVDLLAAVESVCLSRPFVSKALAELLPRELAGKQPPKRFHEDKVFAPVREVGN